MTRVYKSTSETWNGTCVSHEILMTSLEVNDKVRVVQDGIPLSDGEGNTEWVVASYDKVLELESVSSYKHYIL